MAKNIERDAGNEAIVTIGGNYRIEPGPPRKTATATVELLHDDVTAPHYHLPVDNGEGKLSYARDADGKPIEEGKEFTYLDWGGNANEGERVFYVYEKTPINSVDEFIDGEPNPHFVADHVREAAERGEYGDNRVAYDYFWKEIDTLTGTEEDAIAYCNEKL